MQSPEKGTFHCRGMLLTCSSNLSACFFLCNSMQDNGENGCWNCLQPGNPVRTVIHRQCHTFSYQNHNPKGPITTMESVHEDGMQPAKLQQQGVTHFIVNGVKGLSGISLLQYCNFVNGVAIDYMHGVLPVEAN